MEARQYYRTKPRHGKGRSTSESTGGPLATQFLISTLLLAGILISSWVELPGVGRALGALGGMIRYEGESLEGVWDGMTHLLLPIFSPEEAPVHVEAPPEQPTHQTDTRIEQRLLEGLDSSSPPHDGYRPLSDTNRPLYEPQVEELPISAPISPAGEGVRISSGFGYRQSPITGEQEFHNGIDFALPVGAEVVAIQHGYVTYVGYNALSGRFMRYATVDGYLVGYAHLYDTLVEVGHEIRQGQVIALSGDSGAVSGPHLHISIWRDGELLDPAYVLGL